jgi:hypothetical protein
MASGRWTNYSELRDGGRQSRHRAERSRAPRVPFADAFRFWVKLGFISFGGPAGQIAIMHRELVDRRRWISEGAFCTR